MFSLFLRQIDRILAFLHLGNSSTFWNNEGVKRYSINTFWPLFTRVVNVCISLVVTIYLTRYLGPANYGQLSYAISFVGLFAIIGSFGIDNVLYRELLQHPEQRNKYLGSAFVLKLVAGTLAAVVSVMSAWLFAADDVSRIIILILAGTFVFNAFNVIIYEFQARVNQKPLSLAAITVVCILNLLKVAVIVFDQGVIYIGLVLLLEPILYALFYIFIRLRSYGSMLAWQYDKAISRSIIRDSWPFIFIAAFASIYARIDQVMLKHLMDSSAVGFYDAAVRIAEAWWFVPGIITSSLFPAIINGKLTSALEYRKRLASLSWLLIVLSILIIAPASLFAKPLMLLIYGPTFAASASVFAIYIWSGLFISLSLVGQYFLLAENRRKIIFFTSLGTMVLNVVLNIILIPPFGIVGAAWATLISYTVLTLPVLMIYRIR